MLATCVNGFIGYFTPGANSICPYNLCNCCCDLNCELFALSDRQGRPSAPEGLRSQREGPGRQVEPVRRSLRRLVFRGLHRESCSGLRSVCPHVFRGLQDGSCVNERPHKITPDVCTVAGEDLGHPGLWRPTEPHQGQEDSDWSLQEGGAY